MILALLSLDRDPANPVNGFANAVTNVVCALDLYRVDGGNGYAHSKGGAANAMATEQAPARSRRIVSPRERRLPGRRP